MLKTSNSFSNNITIYHGSEFTIDKPEYGVGRINNDYGLGFYTTIDKKLAGEWAVLTTQRSGYINEYRLDTSDLKILDLENIDILNVIALLMSNRGGTFNRVGKRRREVFLTKYLKDTSQYDIIRGWRADDSFFDYINSFLSSELSVEKLTEAIAFGNLGMQICLKSEKAFDSLTYIKNTYAHVTKYLPSAMFRDKNARHLFYNIRDAEKGTLILKLIGEI